MATDPDEIEKLAEELGCSAADLKAAIQETLQATGADLTQGEVVADIRDILDQDDYNVGE